MTVHLELDYRGPLPLGERLVLRGRVAENEGRKSLIIGTIALASAPDDALVEARGLFVVPRPEKLAAYFGASPTRPGSTGRRTARATPSASRRTEAIMTDVEVAAAAARAAADVLLALRGRRPDRPGAG